MQAQWLKPRELVIIVPTYNERENIAPLICSLGNAVRSVEWEVLFVDDDSPDGTPARIQDIAKTNDRVRLLARVGQRGLSSACIQGILNSCSPFIAIMDADLQHDESILLEMLWRLKSQPADIVIGSRMVPGGSIGEVTKGRALLSKLASFVTRLACPCGVSDPMSGFFMMRREFVDRFLNALVGSGFKLLFEILMTCPLPARVVEVPYRFRSRRWGESKLSVGIELQYLHMLSENILHRRLRRTPSAV